MWSSPFLLQSGAVLPDDAAAGDVQRYLAAGAEPVYLLVGGIWLAKLGGSLYYIIAGVISLVTAWLLYRRRSSALLLYAIFLFGTTVWAVWEVGTDFWALTPRLDVTFFLGLWILLPVVYNQMLAKNAFARGALAVSLLFTVIVLAGFLTHPVKAFAQAVALGQ